MGLSCTKDSSYKYIKAEQQPSISEQKFVHIKNEMFFFAFIKRAIYNLQSLTKHFIIQQKDGKRTYLSPTKDSFPDKLSTIFRLVMEYTLEII